MNNNTYRFLDFELEPAQRRLARQGRAIALTPKVFDTLVLLVERAGQVVTKEELMRALWPRGYVEESNLTKHIWVIRRALGEGDRDAGLIETLPKIGYRFAAPVTLAGTDTAAAHAAEAVAAPGLAAPMLRRCLRRRRSRPRQGDTSGRGRHDGAGPRLRSVLPLPASGGCGSRRCRYRPRGIP